MPYAIEGGLIVGPEAGQCAGYIFNFEGHGAYDPGGLIKVGDLHLTQEQVDTHNKILAEAELDAISQAGRGMLYFSYEREPKCTPENPRWKIERNGGFRYSGYKVSNWAGTWSTTAYARKSEAWGFGGGMDRWDVWFTGPDGRKWYGVNKGDSQILRARRLKNQAA